MVLLFSICVIFALTGKSIKINDLRENKWNDCRQLSCIPLLIASRGEMQTRKLRGIEGEELAMQ